MPGVFRGAVRKLVALGSTKLFLPFGGGRGGLGIEPKLNAWET